MQLKQLALIGACLAPSIFAGNVLQPGAPVLDRPTLTVLGVKLPISGDDNYNAAVTVRFRESGTQSWSTALPLFRVHPNTVANYSIVPQFSGSIFDLKPGTQYDIELHAHDDDGPVDRVFTITGTTRPVPSDPDTPRVRNVSDMSSLRSALQSARPGDVITLANGVYRGSFTGIGASGTAQNPIVIRGASQDGVILDGAGCGVCNVIEVYGSYTYIENLTIQNAQRAIRFQGNNTIGNVVERVQIKNTVMGIGGKGTQYDYYIADNILEGRLRWPRVYTDDNGAHSNDDGISVSGFGHVVAYNRISGYGDAMKTLYNGARAVDFYGNDVLWTYDNALELDGSEGNARAFRNRFTNTYMPISVQPVHAGPAYIFRNVVVNAVSEQIKFHAELSGGVHEPNGVLVYNNTFVSPQHALLVTTPAASHHIVLENNLFVGPDPIPYEMVHWDAPIDDGTFNANAYSPDGRMFWHFLSLGGTQVWSGFSQMQAAGMESRGMVLLRSPFASGLLAPLSYRPLLSPQDVTPGATAPVVDAAIVLPNINDSYDGAGPDIGAIERGCSEPAYGVRPYGTDETNEAVGCDGGPAPSVVTVSVSPDSASLAANSTQQFRAVVSGTANGDVTWTVTPAVGSISGAGLYTAPASITSAQTVTVMATSAADPSKSDKAVISLVPVVSVSLTPSSVSLGAGATQQFVARVSGASTTAVKWTLSPAVGSISESGLYTAPASVTAAQNVTVVATSFADNSKSATAVVSLVPNASVSLAPASVSLGAGATQQFVARVSSASNTAVTWSLSPAVGTITSSGLYTAPASIGSAQTITLKAISTADPSKYDTAVISLIPAASVSLAPASVSLGAGDTQQFIARVSNTSNSAVTWSVSPAVGSITAAGLYTAPASIASAQTITLTATSTADPSKSDTAVISLVPAASISLTPTSVSLGAGATQQFTARVANASNAAVMWSISPAIGSISASGFYTAPALIGSAQTVTVTATSVADPSKSARATISLTVPVSQFVTVRVAPTWYVVHSGASQQFTATVDGANDQRVTWNVSGVGTISPSGVYTAPSAVTTLQWFTLTATSVANPASTGSAVVILAP